MYLRLQTLLDIIFTYKKSLLHSCLCLPKLGSS